MARPRKRRVLADRYDRERFPRGDLPQRLRWPAKGLVITPAPMHSRRRTLAWPHVVDRAIPEGQAADAEDRGRNHRTSGPDPEPTARTAESALTLVILRGRESAGRRCAGRVRARRERACGPRS